ASRSDRLHPHLLGRSLTSAAVRAIVTALPWSTTLTRCHSAEVISDDWWPIRGEAHFLDRLSTMPVTIEYKETTTGRGAMSSDDTEHQHTPDEEREIREAALDETIEESFPASDPASSN